MPSTLHNNELVVVSHWHICLAKHGSWAYHLTAPFIAELIVHGELDPWLPADGKVLDLCTGNGSLAILTALHYPDLHITASDLSLPALALAARNVERHHVNNQIDVFHGDLWNALPDTEEDHRFDLIICNPPYVNEASM
ncbi:MAG: hypothetical protein RJB52_324, partial [Pseudomonadota bacterium]